MYVRIHMRTCLCMSVHACPDHAHAYTYIHVYVWM